MISISKKVEYGVELVSFMSKNRDKIISLSEIAASLMLPYRFLGQLAIGLRAGGIIEGREGKNGGYKLREGWQKKSVYDLIGALGENKGLVKCLGEGLACVRADKCRFKKLWQRVEGNLILDLKKIKLNEI